MRTLKPPEKDIGSIYRNARPRAFGDSRKKTAPDTKCPVYQREVAQASLRRLVKAERTCLNISQRLTRLPTSVRRKSVFQIFVLNIHVFRDRPQARGPTALFPNKGGGRIMSTLEEAPSTPSTTDARMQKATSISASSLRCHYSVLVITISCLCFDTRLSSCTFLESGTKQEKQAEQKRLEEEERAERQRFHDQVCMYACIYVYLYVLKEWSILAF